MSLLKKLFAPISFPLTSLLLIFPGGTSGQVVTHPGAGRPAAPRQEFSEADLKVFINAIFATAQGVRPELRAAGLRHLASVIVSMDSSRALWVYDQAFRSAEQLSAPDKRTLRESLERDIILDEAKLDLSRAVDHALTLQPEPATAATARSGEQMKLILLADLMRRVPADDRETLFQKIAPVLVQEDVDFDQTLTIAQFFQKDLPERTQQLYTQAVGKFDLLPADEALISTFASLTRVVGSTNPILAEMGVDVLLKKADEVDAKLEKERAGDPQYLPSQEGVFGPTHLLMLSQFLPLMQKTNPARAREWTETLQDKRNQENLKQSSTRRAFRAGTSADAPSPFTPGSAASTPPAPRQASAGPPGTSPKGTPDRTVEDPNQPTTPEQMMTLAMQPPSAFSLALTRDLVKAQTLSKNQPVEYSRRLEEILPRLQLENNPQAKGSALAQIALAYFQMGDPVQARKYLSESLAQSEQGDSPLLRNSTSPPLFFTMYSATSNAVVKVAPQFPHEAVDAMKSISDSQLRLRVMIDVIRSLGPLISTSARRP